MDGYSTNTQSDDVISGLPRQFSKIARFTVPHDSLCPGFPYRFSLSRIILLTTPFQCDHCDLIVAIECNEYISVTDTAVLNK